MLSGLRPGRPLPPGRFLVFISGRFISIDKTNYFVGNRSRNLPACSIIATFFTACPYSMLFMCGLYIIIFKLQCVYVTREDFISLYSMGLEPTARAAKPVSQKLHQTAAQLTQISAKGEGVLCSGGSLLLGASFPLSRFGFVLSLFLFCINRHHHLVPLSACMMLTAIRNRLWTRVAQVDLSYFVFKLPYRN
jgi:hypothetical protein